MKPIEAREALDWLAKLHIVATETIAGTENESDVFEHIPGQTDLMELIELCRIAEEGGDLP